MSSTGLKVDRRTVPDVATALLTIKIGDVSRTSRKHLAIITFGFLLSEGLDVFRAKTDSCTDKALGNFQGERHVREDTAIYMRPGAHSKQAELVEITPKNFENRVARSYKNYLKRKTGDPFQCEVYVYVKKVAPVRRRRMKDSVVTSTSEDQVLLQGDCRQSNRLDGDISVTGTGFLKNVPGLKRKRSVGSEDKEEHPNMQKHVDDSYYRTVRMVVNGAVVPMQVNVHDLLICLSSFQQQTLFNSTGEESLRDNERDAH
ncbi:unnamed protein product [Peronospora belbahrii]|uniref:Uncharacterized protein n=1 Tax=Peronospora belbahrii TaxID=622444 RepID=A0AAU9LH12_9STRA|nr:unnamed protein product [Peronospora belbahrii]